MSSLGTSIAATDLVVKTIQIDDVPNLLSLLKEDGGLAWVTGPAENQVGVIGWSPIAREEFSGAERFSRAQRWWSSWSSATQGDEPIAFSSFAFDRIPGSSIVIVPSIAIRRTAQATTLTVIARADGIADRMDEARALIAQERPVIGMNAEVTWHEGVRHVSEWEQSVDAAVARINAGELDKVVLARDLVAQLDSSLHVGALLIRLNSAFPECWTFSVDGLVGATPELLIRREGDAITSRVLAGTVRRSRDQDRDGQLAAELLGSEKDQEEHEYAVQSVAAALAAHCTDLQVPTSPSILRLANVQHLATDVTGQLVDGAPALALAASLHPTAAVCGTPTERAFTIIRDLEKMDRGRYAAPVGWFNASGDGEFGIALRCAQIENDERTQLRLYAGCGIVAGSTGESEVAESQAKFAAMKDALN